MKSVLSASLQQIVSCFTSVKLGAINNVWMIIQLRDADVQMCLLMSHASLIRIPILQSNEPESISVLQSEDFFKRFVHPKMKVIIHL